MGPKETFIVCRFHKYKYKNNIDILIITLIKNGYYQTHLKKLGVKIYSLNLDQKLTSLKF